MYLLFTGVITEVTIQTGTRSSFFRFHQSLWKMSENGTVNNCWWNRNLSHENGNSQNNWYNFECCITIFLFYYCYYFLLFFLKCLFKKYM